jgi:hypothetical protein
MAPPVYSTTLFPDVRGQAYDRRRIFQSYRSPAETAADQSLNASSGASGLLWAYNLGWNVLPVGDAQAIFHAVEFMGGDNSGLFFFEWPALQATNVFVALADGTASPITLPVKGALSASTFLRANGVSMAGTFSSGTGASGEDRFTPSVSTTAGQTIRSDFFGRRRRKIRPVDHSSFKMAVAPQTAPLLYTATLSVMETTASDV